MKKHWRKLAVVGAMAAVVLLLLGATGGQLARPERQKSGQDRFIGLYVVSDRWNSGYQPYQEEGWVEYGTQTMDTNLGALDLPRMILPAHEEEGDYTFPGLKGLRCFVTETERDGAVYSASHVDLGDPSIAVGNGTTIEGTLYLLPEQEKDIFTFYRVYQTPEGMVYLDGSGNSTDGVTGSIEESQTETVRKGEEETSVTTTVTVHLQTVTPKQQVTVTWFSEENRPLRTEEIPLEGGDTAELSPAQGAAWFLVTEVAVSGEATRTSYDIGEEELWHTIPLPSLENPGRSLTLHLAPG